MLTCALNASLETPIDQVYFWTVWEEKLTEGFHAGTNATQQRPNQQGG